MFRINGAGMSAEYSELGSELGQGGVSWIRSVVRIDDHRPQDEAGMTDINGLSCPVRGLLVVAEDEQGSRAFEPCPDRGQIYRPRPALARVDAQLRFVDSDPGRLAILRFEDSDVVRDELLGGHHGQVGGPSSCCNLPPDPDTCLAEQDRGEHRVLPQQLERGFVGG